MAIIKRRTVAKKGGSRKFTPKRAVGKVVVKKSPTRVATKKVYKKSLKPMKPKTTVLKKKTVKTFKPKSLSTSVYGKKLSNMKKNVKMNKVKLKKKKKY